MSLKKCISLLFILGFFSSLVQSDFGRVEIKTYTQYSSNNQYVVYDLYKPNKATETAKAPFIAIIPGFQRSKEALSNVAIELSRRGHVVGLIDPYAQGLSSSSLSRRAATTQGYGMFALIQHIHDSDDYNYVNKELLGTTGHSMGGNAAIRGANYFGNIAKKNDEPSLLHSVYVSGYVLTLLDEVLKDITPSETRGSIFERRGITKFSGLTASIIYTRLTYQRNGKKLSQNQNRAFMTNISRRGAGVIFDLLSPKEIDKYCFDALTDALKP